MVILPPWLLDAVGHYRRDPNAIKDALGGPDKPAFRNNDPAPSLWTRLKNGVKNYFSPKEEYDPEEIRLTDAEDRANYLDEELERQDSPKESSIEDQEQMQVSSAGISTKPIADKSGPAEPQGSDKPQVGGGLV